MGIHHLDENGIPIIPKICKHCRFWSAQGKRNGNCEHPTFGEWKIWDGRNADAKKFSNEILSKQKFITTLSIHTCGLFEMKEEKPIFSTKNG